MEATPLHVIKRDGSRQPFDRTKLLRADPRVRQAAGVARADRAGGGHDEASLRNGVGDEVEAARIGEETLRVLRGPRPGGAYVRFASVYRDFQNVDEFKGELRSLKVAKAGSASGKTNRCSVEFQL